MRALQVLYVAADCEGVAILENPFSSKIRYLPAWKIVEGLPAVTWCRSDSCRFGSIHLKPFRFLGAHVVLDSLSLRCKCGAPHVKVEGKYTKASAAYGPALSQALADTLCRGMKAKIEVNSKEEFFCVGGLENHLVNDVMVGGKWDACASWTFRKPSHINILEMASIFRLCSMLASTRPHFRVVARLVDSSVIRGALSKGRTASRGLRP